MPRIQPIALALLMLLASAAFASAATTHYVDNSPSAGCSDAGAGTSPSAPWCTVAKAAASLPSFAPGDSVLFKCDDRWNEQFTVPSGVHGRPGRNIVIGHYGSNCMLPKGGYTSVLPVIDGGSMLARGIFIPDKSAASYVTIDGFDVRNTTLGGINVIAYRGNKPGIVIENNNVHQVGPGACSGCGSPNDSGRYGQENAGISFSDYGSGDGMSYSDGVKILRNTVWDTGGHNTMRVHFDGSPDLLVEGNTVGPGCIHNCIDTKGINGTVSHNIATCPDARARGGQCGPRNAGFYSENNAVVAGTHPHWEYNIAHHIGIGFQCQGPKPNDPVLYNNTIYATTAYGLYFGCTSGGGDVRKNIISGKIANAAQCITTWDYNDTYGAWGALSGPHDISVNPSFAAPDSIPPDFHTLNVTINGLGASISITPQAFVGAVGPGL
jgi:hypothetical protein